MMSPHRIAVWSLVALIAGLNEDDAVDGLLVDNPARFLSWQNAG